MKHLRILLLCFLTFPMGIAGQTIGAFTSIEPASQDEDFHIPASHAFQLLIAAGDNLTSGGIMPINSDFTGYVPIGGSSENGYLGVNSEFVPGGHTILDINFNPGTKLWELTSSVAVDFSALGNFLVPGTSVNCSGGLTPWGTIVTCEENVIGADLNGDGYTDFGWNIEIDPVTRTVVDQTGDADYSNDKLWAMGRVRHENVVIAADSQTVYYGDDDSGTGYIYKFVCDQKTKLHSGSLYVLQQVGNTGSWIQINNTTKSDRNNTLSLSGAVNATKYNRVEDVEIGPDGMVYFASTGVGRVFRFRDNGATVSDFEVFVENQPFTVNYGTGTRAVTFSGPDNLAFDGEGNLWVCQDGGGKHIWVVGPNHTNANPSIRVFGNTPLDSEPTGITFSPDFRFMFISMQHPDNGNSVQATDAAGQTVIFNRDATLVVARKENLGTAALDVATFTQSEPAMHIVHLFPNPTEGEVKVQLQSFKSGRSDLNIYDRGGRLVLSQKLRVRKGITEFPIDARDFAPGKYYLSIRMGEYVTGKKFVKH